MLNELIYMPEIHIENNIKFRAESSKVLSHFKISQSTVFSEIYQNPIHEFSKTAKEIILAKYDAWFVFLIDTEHLLTLVSQDNFNKNKNIINYILNKINKKYLRSDEIEFFEKRLVKKLNESDVKQIIKIFALYRNRIMMSIFKNEKIFDQTFIEIWKEMHKYLFEEFLNKIINTNYTFNSPTNYFIELGYFLTLLLHHTLYEVYEIDSFNKNYFILNYDKVVDELYNNKINLLIEKLKIFKKYKNIKELTLITYYNKNESLLNELKEYCQKNNIELKMK